MLAVLTPEDWACLNWSNRVKDRGAVRAGLAVAVTGAVTSAVVTLHLQQNLLYFAVVGSVLVACGMVLVFALRETQDEFALASVLLLLLPFHTILDKVVVALIKSHVLRLALSSWKEIGLLALALRLVVGAVARQSRPVRVNPIIVLAGALALWGLIRIGTADTLRIGIAAYRDLFIGVPALIGAYLLHASESRRIDLAYGMMLQGAALAVWGFVSRYVLDYVHYLVTMGFAPENTTWAHLLRATGEYRWLTVFSANGGRIVRANSVFVGPNEFGLYLAVVLVLGWGVLLYLRLDTVARRQVGYVASLGAMAFGCLISVSRSAWVLLVVGAVVVLLSLPASCWRRLVGVGALLVAVTAVAAMPNLRSYAERTLRLQEPSAAWRAESVGEALLAIRRNPMGIGLANANYRFVGETRYHVHTESHLVAVALELGWPGLALHLALMLASFAKCWTLSRRGGTVQRMFAATSAGILLGTLLAQVTSAITMDWLFQVYLWFHVGTVLALEEEHTRG